MNHPHYSIACWVYITETGILRRRTIAFCLDDDLRVCVAQMRKQGQSLVYCRRFGNMVDALAHKMLLESLGRGSVKKMIREMNPQYINLAE